MNWLRRIILFSRATGHLPYLTVSICRPLKTLFHLRRLKNFSNQSSVLREEWKKVALFLYNILRPTPPSTNSFFSLEFINFCFFLSFARLANKREKFAGGIRFPSSGEVVWSVLIFLLFEIWRWSRQRILDNRDSGEIGLSLIAIFLSALSKNYCRLDILKSASIKCFCRKYNIFLKANSRNDY